MDPFIIINLVFLKFYYDRNTSTTSTAVSLYNTRSVLIRLIRDGWQFDASIKQTETWIRHCDCVRREVDLINMCTFQMQSCAHGRQCLDRAAQEHIN